MFESFIKKYKPASIKELRERGILGMNARNADYILPSNRRKFYPRVDDKVITKKICHANGIVVPELYFVIDRHSLVKKFSSLLGDRQAFVIKPSRGAGGRGILVISKSENEEYTTSGGRVLHSSDIQYHLSTIISGLYSLGGLPDKAIVEERIVCLNAFDEIAYGGTPDIRVIVYQNKPVMAMLRLPTKLSNGRANLHQGAIGAGVDIATGITTRGVQKNKVISVHPDTLHPVSGVAIPFWERIIEMSIALSQALELGYVGIDLVIDKDKGPIVLEANARPGLTIQISNGKGLKPLLDTIKKQSWAKKSRL